MGRALFYVPLHRTKLHSYDWVETLINDEVISRVEELTEAEGQPTIADNVPLFEWGMGNIITDEATHHNVHEIINTVEGEQQYKDFPQTTQQLDVLKQHVNHTIPLIDEEEGAIQIEDGLGPDPDNPPENEEQINHTPIDKEKEIDSLYQEMEAQLDSEINKINNIPEVYTIFSDNTSNSQDSESSQNTDD